MKVLALLCLLACDPYARESKTKELDEQISENQQEIIRINQLVFQIEARTKEIQTMVGCINGALDSSMNDHDQVLTIEECARDARFR